MNPHIQNAIHTISEANNPNSVWESGDTERLALQIEASTRATLALADEQRTANLIAMFGQARDAAQELMQPAFADPDSFAAKQLAKWNEIGKQIEERLDLA